MVALELFLFPGTVVVGLIGAALMLIAVVMATADVYPGMPALPSIRSLELSLKDILIAFTGATVAIGVLGRVLPRTSVYGKLVSQSASGVSTVAQLERQQASRVGQIGFALSTLRPGGKAQFGDKIIDVISQGEMIGKGQRIKIIGHSSTEAIVEAVS